MRPAEDNATQSQKKRGIIMAHPYAPMGGSYDDRIVGIVVHEFLKAGWIVGTFNFRYSIQSSQLGRILMIDMCKRCSWFQGQNELVR